jgi:hypothetical protein
MGKTLKWEKWGLGYGATEQKGSSVNLVEDQEAVIN